MKNLSDEKKQALEFISDHPLNNGKNWDRVLDTRDSDIWRFRLSKSIYALLFFLLLLPLPLAMGGSWICLLFLVFILVIFLLFFKNLLAVPTFDFRNGCFYRDWKKPKYGDVTLLNEYLPLSGICGFQLLYKVVRGRKGSVHQRYELNLVTDGFARIFVAECSNYSNIRKAAEMLSEKLNVPLVEHDRHKITVKPVPRWVPFIFLIAFSGMGLLALHQTILLPLWKNHCSQKWNEAAAVVTESFVSSARRRSKNSSYTVYKAEIKYKYHVNGKFFKSDNYSFFDRESRSPRSARQLVSKYPVGLRFSCYYDPANPSLAVVDRSISAFSLVSQTVFCVVFIGAGIGVFIMLWSKRKK